MEKQNEVMKFLLTVSEAHRDEIYHNVSFGYYANHKKHLGALLSRMVKNGKIERVKQGVFRITRRPVEVKQGQLL